MEAAREQSRAASPLRGGLGAPFARRAKPHIWDSPRPRVCGSAQSAVLSFDRSGWPGPARQIKTTARRVRGWGR